MVTATCKIEECDKRAKGRGMCAMHYERWRQHGDPHFVTDRKGEKRGPRHKNLREHLMQSSTVDGECRVWSKGISPNGYGKIRASYDGENYAYVHRLSYRIFKGEIPPDTHIDHICHNRACINPDHLRLASNKQNHENLKGARVDSKSGIRGAIWSSRDERYIATVWHHGERHIAGYFVTPEEAGEAAARLRASLFTHH